MQIVIPAAGKGSRLGNLTESNTKGMIEVNGHTLIARTLESIKGLDVKEY